MRAGLPIRQKCRCIDKLLVLHRSWSNLLKHKSRASNRKKEEQFCYELKNFFDISHGSVLKIVDEKRRTFLQNQRRNGRVGHIADVKGLFGRTKVEQERESSDSRRMEVCSTENSKLLELSLSEEDSPFRTLRSRRSIGASSDIPLRDDANGNDAGPSGCKKSPGKSNIFDNKVTALLDRCQVSDKDAAELIAAIAEALNADPKPLSLG